MGDVVVDGLDVRLGQSREADLSTPTKPPEGKLGHGNVKLHHGQNGQRPQAINAAGSPAVVRVLWNDPGLIGFALDMGAAAVIVPMVNAVEQRRWTMWTKSRR